MSPTGADLARAGTLFAASVGFMLLACAPEKTPAKGQITLAISSDLSIPKDINGLRIQIRSGGRTKFDRDYRLGRGPSEVRLPATLALVAGEEPGQRVDIRVIGLLADEARTLNHIVTTVPETRNTLLRVPIQWLCQGQVVEEDGVFQSTCGASETCVAGECRSTELDSSSLPIFDPTAVFGGAPVPGDPNGACFPVEQCFQDGFEVAPDDACEVSVDARQGDELTLAIALEPGGDGICSGLRCYVPLDQSDEFGVREIEADADGNRRFALPPAVCERLGAERVTAVFATTACPAKAPNLPTCGFWSSVGGAPPDPPDGCPGFRPGSELGPLLDDALANQYLQAIADLHDSADRRKTVVAESCLGLSLALSGPEIDLGDPPSNTQVEEVCATALGLYETSTARAHFAVGSTQCLVSTDAQVACETACFAFAEGDAVSRCELPAGDCAGDCLGACHAGPSAPSACDGECRGLCVGDCSDACLGTFAAGPDDACGGTCLGTCTGTCVGACSRTSNDTCSGTCVATDAGACDDWAEPPGCASVLTPAAPKDRICDMICQSAAGLEPICTTTNTGSDGMGAAVLNAVRPIHEELEKIELLRQASRGLADLALELADVSIDPGSTRCIDAAGTALAEARATLGVTRAAAESIVNAPFR